jgi:hypothetical protein
VSSSPDVWVAKDDGTDIVRASAIAGVGRDYNGNITVRLYGGEPAIVTLVSEGSHDGSRTPDDFHLQLLRVVAELADAAEPAIIRPSLDERRGWSWQAQPLQEP